MRNNRYVYKAKRVDNGEWICGSLITGVFHMTESGADIPYILNADESDADCFEDFTEGVEYLEVIPETICQCAGLKDKNGKLIWENDIVDCNAKRGEAFHKCLVLWNECKARFDVMAMDCNFPMILDECTDDISISGSDYEVVGNRFDNPELLEV